MINQQAESLKSTVVIELLEYSKKEHSDIAISASMPMLPEHFASIVIGICHRLHGEYKLSVSKDSSKENLTQVHKSIKKIQECMLEAVNTLSYQIPKISKDK